MTCKEVDEIYKIVHYNNKLYFSCLQLVTCDMKYAMYLSLRRVKFYLSYFFKGGRT